LLACTGLRISEALRLKRDDVDLDGRLLSVSASKFDAGRLLPLHPSATQALHRYAQVRDRCHPAPSFPQFFLSAQGRALAYCMVLTTFRQIRERLGWAEYPGGRAPRIHDLRHSFACHTLEDWYRRGVNIDHAMLFLSTYLGHRNVRDTYWYLTGVPALMALATERFERSSGPNPGGRP
jgi:integrase